MPTASSVHGRDLFRIAHNGTDQFEEARRYSQEDAGQIKPRGVQPAVERRANQPSYDEGSGKDECQLAVAGSLNPEILFPARLRISRIWVGRGHLCQTSYIRPAKPILRLSLGLDSRGRPSLHEHSQ